MVPEGYGTSNQENPFFSREMPKPPEPRHHTATHYGAVPGFISSGHASDAGSTRASDAGSGNEGRRPSAGAARPSTATPSSPTARSRTSHSAGPSSRCVPRPPIDDVYVFLAAGRGPRPRRVVNPHPTEYPPTKPHVI